MTIAAASPFAAPISGAAGQPQPSGATPTTGFVEAMVGALTTETAAPVAALAPAAAAPDLSGTTPTRCAMLAPTSVDVFGQDGGANPIATPSAPGVEAPVPPSSKPTLPGKPAIEREVAQPNANDPPLRIARSDDQGAASKDTRGDVAPSAPIVVRQSAASPCTEASEAVPGTEPADREPARDLETTPEPVDVERPVVATAFPASLIVPGSSMPSKPAATLRPVDPDTGDQPSVADEARPAGASGKPLEAQGPRDSVPAAVAPSPTATFAERLPASGDGAAAPPVSPVPVSIGGASMPPVAVRAPDLPAPAPPPRHEPIVDVRPGHLGREMGVEIAKRLGAGGEELTVRLNPVELGRIEVRLSFNERGSLRAAVTAESAVALEMLRRDSADLGRALTDAGVRADATSFRFDGQSNGREGGQFWQRQQAANGRPRASGSGGADEPVDPHPIYRTLRASGRVNLVA